MNSVWNKAVPAVRKETGNVAFYTVVGVLVMWGVYGGMQGLLPGIVSLDAAVFLGGICGGLVAVLNFLCGRGSRLDGLKLSLFRLGLFLFGFGLGLFCLRLCLLTLVTPRQGGTDATAA